MKGLITLTATHGGKIPSNTKFKKTPAATVGLYESTFTLSGGLSGTFRGSIYPDDMTVKGRVEDGTYPLHIGFHKGGKKPPEPASALVVKTQDIRAGLLVNCRNPVRIITDHPNNPTSEGINVHNGFDPPASRTAVSPFIRTTGPGSSSRSWTPSRTSRTGTRSRRIPGRRSGRW